MDPRDRFFKVILPIGAVAVLMTVLTVGWATEPDRFVRGYAPRQPIEFSHKLHAGDNHIPCQYCHTGASRSRHAMVPAVETCMNCHSVTRTDRPAIQQLASLMKDDRPLEWERVYKLPDHVYFDHRPHVRSGIACQTCHGEVQSMDRISRVMNLRMGNCLSCHRDAHAALPPNAKVTEGPTACWGCHR